MLLLTANLRWKKKSFKPYFRKLVLECNSRGRLYQLTLKSLKCISSIKSPDYPLCDPVWNCLEHMVLVQWLSPWVIYGSSEFILEHLEWMHNHLVYLSFGVILCPSKEISENFAPRFSCYSTCQRISTRSVELQLFSTLNQPEWTSWIDCLPLSGQMFVPPLARQIKLYLSVFLLVLFHTPFFSLIAYSCVLRDRFFHCVTCHLAKLRCPSGSWWTFGCWGTGRMTEFWKNDLSLWDLSVSLLTSM